MNILIGNNSLEYLAGSETWAESVALALAALGCTVRGYGRTLGVIAERLQAAGIACVDDPQRLGGFRPSLIVAAHWPVVEALAAAFPRTPLVSVIHGIEHRRDDGSPALEHPSLGDHVSAYVAVSEEVRDKLGHDHGLPSMVLRNAISLHRYPAAPAASRPHHLLFSANDVSADDPRCRVLRDVAVRLGARFVGIGSLLGTCVSPWQEIARADVVFGMGRTVLEGMAMGRLGVVHGRFGTAGVVCADSAPLLRLRNYSGRGSGRCWSADELVRAIEAAYNPDNLAFGPRYVARHHDALVVARTLVDLGVALAARPVGAGPASAAELERVCRRRTR